MEKCQHPPYSSEPKIRHSYPAQSGYHLQYSRPSQQLGYAPQLRLQPQAVYASQSGYQLQSGYPPQPNYIPKPPPLTMPNFYGTTQGSHTQRNCGCCEDSQRNKPQSSSLAAETLIFISGGMSFASSVGLGPAYRFLSEGTKTHMQICWFFAVIIGSCIAYLLLDRISKRIFNSLAAALVIINGTLFVSTPGSVTAIIFARYLDGIAFGLTLIPAIIAASENSVKRFRGIVLSTEQIGLVTGIILQTVCLNLWGYNWKFNTNQMHGILAEICGFLALLFSFIFTIESPDFVLLKNNKTDAVKSLRGLQGPQLVSAKNNALLCEQKQLLDEDNARGRAVTISKGLAPLIKMCLFRGFVTMSFSLPLTSGLILASRYSSFGDYELTLYIYVALRLLGVIMASFIIDTTGRKLPTALSFLIGGGSLLCMGAMFAKDSSAFYRPMDIAVGLLIGYQMFSGIIASASTSLLSEAFSVSVEPYFILVVVVFEYVLQLIISFSFHPTQESVPDFAYAVGALQVAFGIFILVMMTETKKTTSREALAKFKKSINFARLEKDDALKERLI